MNRTFIQSFLAKTSFHTQVSIASILLYMCYINAEVNDKGYLKSYIINRHNNMTFPLTKVTMLTF